MYNMKEYTPTIGLEIHAELKTNTKMFCDSKNDPNERTPNLNICPVCMAHPGTLPVINKEAVKHVLKVGVALNGTLADFTEFDRKNYFYPDLPKGYQISQYEFPLVSGGALDGVAITRVHLEEDTARSQHMSDPERSFVDFNRAGVPLMELVTEPVITNAQQAGGFARNLQMLLRYLEASDANMEKGEMRVEANISVSKDGTLGTKVEVKNLNSFKVVEKAITYEIERQIAVLEAGERVIQETRGWDENTQQTFSQRIKEESADYRYFPDPDLPKLKISEIPEFAEDVLRAELPKLPQERIARYTAMGIQEEDARSFTTNTKLGDLFDAVITELGSESADAKHVALAANYIANDVPAVVERVGESARNAIGAKPLGAIVTLSAEGAISSNAAVALIEANAETTLRRDAPIEEVREYADAHGLTQVNDDSILTSIVAQVLEENPAIVAEYRAGKESVLQYLVGQCMKASKGSANPGKLQEILREQLTAGN